MSGHSKWSTIKHKKGNLDAKRGKIFSKLLKEITIASKLGGAEPHGNPRLRLALEKAKENNLPKSNIERAIKRGTGETEGSNYEEYVYEGYAPFGVGVIIEILTDNKNRTGGEIRHLFTKANGALAEPGAVSWNFERMGCLTIESTDEDKLLELTLEAGATSIEVEENQSHVYCQVENIEPLKQILNHSFKVNTSEIIMKPKNVVLLKQVEEAKSVLDFLEKVEDHDDVQKVFANFDIDKSILDKLE